MRFGTRSVYVLRTGKPYATAWNASARSSAGFTWTAPSKAEAGDLAVLYGKDSKETGLIGIFLTDAVRGKANWWAEIDWTRVRQPLTRDDLLNSKSETLQLAAKALGGQGSHQELDPKVARALVKAMLRGSPQTERRIEGWLDETPSAFGNDLTGLSIYTTADPDFGLRELDLQKRVAASLSRLHKPLRALTDDERLALKLPPSNHLGRIEGAEGRQNIYPDIVLRSRRGPTRVFVIEVKRHAVVGSGKSGIDQLIEYERKFKSLLRQADLAWEVVPVLLAVDADAKVLREAKKHCFETWRARLSKRRDGVTVRVRTRW